MRRSGKAAAAADVASDALMEWLRAQPARTRAVASAVKDGQADPGGLSETIPLPEPAASADPEAPLGTTSRSSGVDTAQFLRLPNPDWLHHRLTVRGSADELTRFRDAASGAGIIPWHYDLARMEADFFHLLVAPQRELSLAGARILARQLCGAVGRRHAVAVSRVGQSRACPFDLHALLPVPAAILALGPDEPEALAWLWEHWGTTEALRHVAVEATREQDTAAVSAAFQVSFWSADWTPWRALEQVGSRWPVLRFDVRPRYEL